PRARSRPGDAANWRHAPGSWTTEVRHDRSIVREFLASLEKSAGLNDLVAGLMNWGGVMVYRPEDRIPVGHPRHKGEMFADLDSRDVSGNGAKRATNVFRGQRFGIPGVQLAWPADQEKDDAVNV